MAMTRVVCPETLDYLPENDPAAQRSRRDLKRVHQVMGTRSIIVKALKQLNISRSNNATLRVLELGAGDGSLMLGVAQSLGWTQVALTLLDRQNLVSPETVECYGKADWKVVTEVVDVMDWALASTELNGSAQNGVDSRWDLIIANLFLHHFEGIPLTNLLHAIATQTKFFFACEPRRALIPLIGSHMVGVIGANKVTRTDAVLSVQAGFSDCEITAQWPSTKGRWQLTEYSAGLFSHCFVAEHCPAKQTYLHHANQF